MRSPAPPKRIKQKIPTLWYSCGVDMDIAALIKDVGFPVAVCCWLAFRVEKKLDSLLEGQRAFGVAVKLFAAMSGVELEDSK